MTTKFMAIFLSQQPADGRWGEKALLSVNNDGITIHLGEYGKLGTIQRAARKLDNQGIRSVRLAGDDWNLERCWSFWQGFRSPKGQYKVEWPTLPEDERRELDNRLQIINWVRDTINMPADTLGPKQLATRVIDLMNNLVADKVSYTILKGNALIENGYNGLYTVGRGSNRSPVLLTLDYNPSGNPDTPVDICLVGKGITFDSGGYSLKPSSSMDSMKSDMGGAATITGGLALAIMRGLNRRVKLYLCCADNLVSGNAFKLGDIIHYRNGKSVEIMNTDAEGRLVLADGLIDASKQSPGLLIDCATLTGAAKVALGNDYHALLTFDDALAEALLESARIEHEAFWRLPLAECHRNQLPSNFADLSNVAGGAHTAGASTAAGFLSHFVKDYHSGWVHIDCSATYRKSAVEQWSAGATGIGVRSLANLLLQYSKN